MRGGLNALRFFILGLVIVLGALTLFLYSDAGKSKVIELVLARVNHRDYKIKIEDIESYVPLKIKFSHIKIFDKGQPQAFLRGVTLITDGMDLLTDNAVRGDISIDECLLFDTPSEHDPLPLHLTLHVDLKVNCKSVLIEEDGANYFIRAAIEDSQLVYDPVRDNLSYDGTVHLKIWDEPMPVKVSARGQLNDFALAYEIPEGQHTLGPAEFTKVKGVGKVEHLPWKGQGQVDLSFIYQKSPGSFQAKFVQDKFLFRLDQISLKAQGISLQGGVEYNARSTALKGDINAQVIDFPIAGKLNLNTKFDYHGGDLFLQVEAKGNDLRYEEHSIQNLTVQIDGHSLLRQPSGTLRLNVSKTTGPLGPLHEVYCESTFDQGIGNVSVKLRGEKVALNTNLDISYEKPSKLLKLKSFDGRYEDVDIQLRAPSEVTVAGRTVSLAPSQWNIMNSPMALEGEIKDGVLNLRALGELDLMTVSRMYLADDDVLNGKMKVDMRITGKTDKLRLQGSAEMQGGSYENVTYGSVIKDIALKLSADNESMNIVHGTARDANEGKISMAGRLLFSDAALDLQLKADNFMILHTDRTSLVAREMDVTIKGPMQQPTLAGMILVDSASYSIAPQVKSERRILNISNPIQRKKPDILKTAIPKPMQTLFNPNLNLTLKFPPVLKIKGRGLNSNWKGKLEFTQTYERPVVSGKLTVDAGNLNFLGQTVTMQKGTIKFDGSLDNIPYIDTKGLLEKPDLEVTVGIVGRVNKPNIDLESQPALPKDEILSYLFFGKDKSKLSPIEGVQLARALAAYKGVGPDTEFLSIITDNLGLDQFSIGSGPTEGTYTVKLSKRLGDKVRVNLDQGMKPEDSKVELEVDVTKNISVKAEHGFAGSADGASVNYNWDY